MQKTENTIFCKECGKQNSKVNSFCLNCGNELIQEKLEYKNSNTNKGTTIGVNKPINKIDNSSDYLNTDEMNLFIYKNTEYYNEKFNQITKTGSKRTWNWSAFFLPTSWLLYRKMYVQFGIMFLIFVVVNGILSSLPWGGGILSLGVNIVFAMYANSLYLDYIQKKLSKIDSMGYESKESIIRKKGGTNIVFPLIVELLLFIGIFL